MEFDGMNPNEKNHNMSQTNVGLATAQGIKSIEMKVKAQRRNDRVNPLVFLIKKKEEFSEHNE